MTSPRPANAVTVASVRPTPLPPMVMSRSQALLIERFRDRRGIAAFGRNASNLGAGGPRALRDQIRSQRTAGNIDDAQARPAHAQSRYSRRARDQEIARQHAPSGFDDAAARGDIAAGAAHALPRDRLRQHLRQRT